MLFFDYLNVQRNATRRFHCEHMQHVHMWRTKAEQIKEKKLSRSAVNSNVNVKYLAKEKYGNFAVQKINTL